MSSHAEKGLKVNTESDDSYEAHTPGGHVADDTQPTMPIYHRQYGNPAPLGLLAYGTVFLASSLFNINARGIHNGSMVLLFAVFYGGIMQTFVGMWEMFLGNTFGATVFATYGGFNLSYGALYLPGVGIQALYTVDGVLSPDFEQAVGIYLLIWDVITLLFLIGCLRSSVPVVFTFASTVVALTLLAANAFTGIPSLGVAGGAFGLGAAGGAYYAALAGFYSPTVTFKAIRLPPMSLAYPDV